MDFFWKNGRFSGRIWPDWGNTTWADMAGLGFIGLSKVWAYGSKTDVNHAPTSLL